MGVAASPSHFFSRVFGNLQLIKSASSSSFYFLKQPGKKREMGGGHVEEDEDFLCFSWGVRSVVFY
jgi:hypothetical protein